MAYIGRSVSYGNAVTEQFVGDGTADYTLGYETTTDGVVVSLDGVVQVNGTDFNILGNVITFTSVVAAPIAINLVYLGLTLSIGTPGNNTVDSGQLVNGSVDIAHLSATGTPTAALALKGDNTWGTAGGTSLGSGMIRTNLLTISEDITFAGTENGITYGPITIAATKTVTVTSPSVWYIL